MKAVYFPQRDRVAVGDLPDPVAGPGEVVLRVRASGICHTDIEVMRGNYGTSAFPVVPGHEFSGEVVDIGADVTGFSVGERMVVDPNLECGTCQPCRRGWAHLCEKLGAYGVTLNGGFAEFSAVRADRLHPIGDQGFATAALAEPMGCVLNGLSPLRDRIVETALVFGTGPMGLLMGLALRARGTENVMMVDRDETRLEMARTHGLIALRAGARDLADLQRNCDLAVDATGVTQVAGGLIDYVGNGGAALFFGVCAEDARLAISPFEVFRRQLSLFGTHSLNHNVPEALAVIAAIGPAIEDVVTHRLPLEGVAEVIGGQPRTGSMKVQLAL